MARIRLFEEEEATDEELEALAELKMRRPSPIPAEVHRAILRAPSLIEPFLALVDTLRKETELDPALRELAIVAALGAQKSRYEYMVHWNLAKQAGISEEKLEAIANVRDSDIFTDLERAVIQIAVEVTSQVRVTEETWQAVYQQLGDRQAVELLMNIGFFNMSSRLTEPLKLKTKSSMKESPKAVKTFNKLV